MKGALILIATFLIFFAATLAYPSLPLGRQIYDALTLPQTDYLVVGIPATTLICAVFNGVVYGVIGWLVFTLIQKTGKLKL